MNEELKLNDIADNLLILNKTTIDKLFVLDNCTDCIALYLFYYKTAKWQKTNTIKANDTYIKKCLKWGADKIRKTKQILKENGLINIVQRRENGKISGWYIEVSYLVSQKKIEDIKIKVEDNSNNTQNQQVEKATSGNEETNALKEYIKCLKEEIEMLKNNNINSSKGKKTAYGCYGRVKLTDAEYQRLVNEFGQDYIDRQIELLDEYVQSNNNKNRYTDFNLVLRKAIREKWFEKKESNNGKNKRYTANIDYDQFIDN